MFSQRALSLTGFWIHVSLNKYSLTWRVTFHPSIIWYIFRNLSVIVNSDIFRHIHVLFKYIRPCCSIFRTLCNSSESCHIQNQGTFRTLGIFKTPSYFLAYLQHCVTLAYWEPCHIQNSRIFSHIQYWWL